MAVDQSHRFLKIHTSLGDDKFILHKFTGHEKLGNLFEYQLSMFTDDTNDLFDQVLGQNVTVEMEMNPDGGKRYFNGYITEFRFLGKHGDLMHYQAIMRPWLWFLGRTSDCRIFQNKTVVDIITQVFGDHGFSDHVSHLTTTYDPYEYCVQYRETDLNFVSRLMEQEGIYYFFKHENGKHVLHLAQDNGAHAVFTDYDTIIYRPPGESFAGQEHIHSWAAGKEVVSNSVALDDYDFLKPRVELASRAQATFQHNMPGDDYEVYDYPGEYTETTVGNRYAANQKNEMVCRSFRSRGSGNARGLAAGHLFTLSEYPFLSENVQYLIVSATYDVQSDEVETSASTGSDIYFHCDFEVIKSSVTYQSPRLTPKPLVQGLQTAEVVGPETEEIHTDENGRIKVKFHWDRATVDEQGADIQDQDRTCWMRFSTNWAGQHWGTIHIPRIGQEVVVSFLEGDPDRPLVTGSVYNADHMPPWELPQHKTKSGIKSRSSKDGQRDNYNEIRFEDETEKEEFRMQAEMHMNVGVKSIRKTYIGAQLPELDENQHGSVSNLENPVEGAQSGTCPPIGTVNEHLTVFADRETFIEGNDTLEIARHADADRGRCMTVMHGNHELTVEQGDQLITIEQGNREVTVESGDQTTTVSSGNCDVLALSGTITLDAVTAIELKVGNTTLRLEPSGITMSGTMISISGSGTTDISGGVVNIN